MREIFKHKKGKDFYRESLEYFEYDPDMFESDYTDNVKYTDDDEISYALCKKLSMYTDDD
jgi:hypothetical protein